MIPCRQITTRDVSHRCVVVQAFITVLGLRHPGQCKAGWGRRGSRPAWPRRRRRQHGQVLSATSSCVAEDRCLFACDRSTAGNDRERRTTRTRPVDMRAVGLQRPPWWWRQRNRVCGNSVWSLSRVCSSQVRLSCLRRRRSYCFIASDTTHSGKRNKSASP